MNLADIRPARGRGSTNKRLLRHATSSHSHTHTDALACRLTHTHTRPPQNRQHFSTELQRKCCWENFCEFPSEMQSVQTMCVMHMQTRPRPRLSGLCFWFFRGTQPTTTALLSPANFRFAYEISINACILPFAIAKMAANSFRFRFCTEPKLHSPAQTLGCRLLNYYQCPTHFGEVEEFRMGELYGEYGLWIGDWGADHGNEHTQCQVFHQAYQHTYLASAVASTLPVRWLQRTYILQQEKVCICAAEVCAISIALCHFPLRSRWRNTEKKDGLILGSKN